MFIIKLYGPNFPFPELPFPSVNIPPSWHASLPHLHALGCNPSFYSNKSFADETPSQYYFLLGISHENQTLNNTFL